MHTHTWYALLLTVLCNGPVSVRLSHHSTAAVAWRVCCLAAECRAGRRYRSTAVGAAARRSVVSAVVCEQCHVDSRGMRLNTDLLNEELSLLSTLAAILILTGPCYL